MRGNAARPGDGQREMKRLRRSMGGRKASDRCNGRGHGIRVAEALQVEICRSDVVSVPKRCIWETRLFEGDEECVVVHVSASVAALR